MSVNVATRIAAIPAITVQLPPSALSAPMAASRKTWFSAVDGRGIRRKWTLAGATGPDPNRTDRAGAESATRTCQILVHTTMKLTSSRGTLTFSVDQIDLAVGSTHRR